MLFFSHFATHAVCSSPYLLTTLACQTCFATWQQGVVSSLKSWYSVFLVCWSGAEPHCWKLAVCNPGAKLPSSGPASSFANVFFCLFDASFVPLSPQQAVKWTEKMGLRGHVAIAAPLLRLLSPKPLLWATSKVWVFKRLSISWGLWHWLTNDWQRESKCTFSLLSTSPVCYFSHWTLNLFS